MAIELSALAQLTARAGIGRAGTMRAGCAPKIYELKDDGTGQIIWDPASVKGRDPGDPSLVWDNDRE